MCLFSFRKHFCDLFLLFFFCYCFFVLLFRNSKREEVGGEAKGKMHGLWSMIIAYTQLRIIKLPVNPSIILFKKSIWGVRSPSKASSLIKLKSKPHGICMQAYKSPTHFMKKKLSIDCHHKSHIGRHHYSNSLTVSSCNLNWFDHHSVGIYGAEQPPVSVAASYCMQVFERTHALLIQCY